MASKNIQFLRKEDVLKKSGLTRASMYMAIQKHGFPAPVKIGPRSSAWVESEVEEWMQARIEERDGVAA